MLNKIGDYEITGQLGLGGMATVYSAVQPSLRRQVAIKVLSKKLTENQELVDHFNQEAIVIARLSHPNIIPVIDRGVLDGMHYFVMAFIEGEDLSRKIKNKRPDIEAGLDIIMQVCKALSYAHRNGVTHRDIKPSNILLDNEGHAMVMDFGIAQLFDTESGRKRGAVLSQKLAGTLDYMAPEQKMDSGSANALSDIYSLGVTMYELFTGRLPSFPVKPPREINAEIPERLENIINKCIEHEPENRFSSVEELRDSLLGVTKGSHLDEEQKSEALSGMSAIISRFSLLDVLKEGLNGSVYLVERAESGQLMVIKKVRNKTGGMEEAKILSAEKHPNIVDIYGVSGNRDVFITVMENVRGGSLKERLIKPMKWMEALNIIRQAAEGLSFAHKKGICHGNLRPSNILFTENGDVKLSDFGLKEEYANVSKMENWYQLPYEEKSPLTDVYSLGVMAYEMLTGIMPLWRGGQLVNHYQYAKLPAPVRGLVSAMVGRKPFERMQSMDEVISRIDSLFKKYEEWLEKKNLESEETGKEEEEKAPESNFLIILMVTILVLVLAGAVVYYTKDVLPYGEYVETVLEYLANAVEKISALINKNK